MYFYEASQSQRTQPAGALIPAPTSSPPIHHTPSQSGAHLAADYFAAGDADAPPLAPLPLFTRAQSLALALSLAGSSGKRTTMIPETYGRATPAPTPAYPARLFAPQGGGGKQLLLDRDEDEAEEEFGLGGSDGDDSDRPKRRPSGKGKLTKPISVL